MAQVVITHFTEISTDEKLRLTQLARDAAALEVHDLQKSQIDSSSVSVLVLSVDQAASLSGADTEVQVYVSGNNWPLDDTGQPLQAFAAKAHFDKLASRIYGSLSQNSARKLYVWVTPFTASGWAEPV